ncbi:OmpA family protein [Flammeovirga kamogawensis]|uniref:OmpA family protein n=1 Tax=Flammeovirga kamogawensis TaxID=373891 RepID=A0ABX8GY60_9BACT|nr:OmpA family protein [Flammeovirga kamogawensis]MBB6462896.1 outer membrane protein OmpA-like peptidoglycan-associated protein/tetratricopeptide (TPR) repeat protein [Flammeovirga kamogawensis]QWG08324.1 OmpA family protein [Flammeovirga kamogawensis]TRX66619.1 OmpA family protein [Flammeovirga kamogawensis]
MQPKIITFLLFLVFTINSSAQSQNIDFTKDNFPDNVKALKEALRAIEIGDNYRSNYQNYDSAILYYKKAEQLNAKNAILNYKLGLSYFNLTDYNMVDSLVEVSISLNSKYLPAIYLKARSFHLQQKWIMAQAAYHEYVSNYDNYSSPTLNDIQFLLQQTENGERIEVVNKEVINLSNLNSTADDENPNLLPNSNQIYFNSNRFSKNSIQRDIDGNYYQNIYYALIENDSISTPHLVKHHKINPEGNSTISSISKSGKTMVMFLGDFNGKLYYSRFNLEDSIKIPHSKTKLPNPINTYFSSEISGTFTPDGKEFYFSSKRKDGSGGYDIYYSTRKKKGWNKPVNLSSVNTPFNEVDPFFSTHGDTLFFASDSPKSIGGFDIMYATKKGNKWSTIKNIGKGINSPFDDKSPSSSINGDNFYFSSNRNGGKGGYDIYKAQPLYKEKEVIITSKSDQLDDIFKLHLLNTTVILKDQLSKKPLIDADISIFNIENKTLLRKLKTDDKGYSKIEAIPKNTPLAININCMGYEMFSRNINVDSTKKEYIIELKKIKVDQKITLQNIFFDTNSSTISPSSIGELNALIEFLSINKSVEIEIGGHTDTTGNEKDNQKLSEKRADAIVQFLEKNDISISRLTSKGYGASMPIESNDTEEGKAKNRRTEFKVIKN